MSNNKSNTMRNVMILIMLILLVTVVMYVVYQSKVKDTTPTNPNTLDSIDLENTEGLNEKEIIELAKQEILKDNNLINQENSGSVWWVVGIFVLVLGGGILLYMYYFKKQEEEKVLKQPVPIDKIKQIFKERIAKDYGLGWYMDNDGKFQLSNDREFYYRDQRVWYDKQTGDKFLLVEFIVNNGPMFGLHTANIPADKGEKILFEGEWTLKHKRDMEDFKLMPRTYPVTSVADKQERQQMYIAEQIASGELGKDAMNLTSQNQLQNQSKSSKTTLVSPFSSQDDEQDFFGENEDDGETQSQVPTYSSQRYRSRPTSRRTYKR